MNLRQLIGESSEPLQTAFDQFGLRFIASSSLSRILELGAEGFFILSAARPEFDKGGSIDYGRAKAAGAEHQVYAEQFGRYKALQANLVRNHIGYTTLIGKWRDESEDAFHEELSVFVPFHNTQEASFAGLPEAFAKFAFDLAMEFDQTSLVFCAPPSLGERPVVQLWYTGLRDEPKDTKYDIGSFNPASIQDNYLSVLMRANRVQRGKDHTRVTKRFGMPDLEEEVPGRAFKYSSIGVRWRETGWGGQVVISEREILFLLDSENHIRG